MPIRTFGLGQLQHRMYDLRLPFRAGPEAELLESFEHCGVLGQYLRHQFLEARVTRKAARCRMRTVPIPWP